MSFIGRACAKFILLGEHFIVHGGVPALSFPITSLTTNVEIKPIEERGLKCQAYFRSFDGSRIYLTDAESSMEQACAVALDLIGNELDSAGFLVESYTNFPIGRGFGSSASFSVALARAVEALKPSLHEKLPTIVDAMERYFHGNPSGVDAATILAELPIRFENKKLVRTIRNHAVDFVILNSGERVGCKQLVAEVSKQRTESPKAWAQNVFLMKELVENCEYALIKGDSYGVAAAVRSNHEILRSLGLSTETIEKTFEHGIECGALAGKVSGAGAGGAVVLVTAVGQGEVISRRMVELGFDVLGWEKAHGSKESLGN